MRKLFLFLVVIIGVCAAKACAGCSKSQRADTVVQPDFFTKTIRDGVEEDPWWLTV